jgi:S-adenosylmethionine:tRNA ribosyltransferase-isomerase
MITTRERNQPNGFHPASPPPASLAFELPTHLDASEPPEARGLERDQVRLMVSGHKAGTIEHTSFRALPDYLRRGDVLVINTSGTLKAALPAIRRDGTALELHLSPHLPADLWVVELRQPDGPATKPFSFAEPGENLRLPAGGCARLHVPYDPDLRRTPHNEKPSVRLWIATLDIPRPLGTYLDQHGFPIRYKYVRQEWPIAYYQTVFAWEMGSAEMPSAGRPFTDELITSLVAKGVQVAPLLLHTGVASLESHERPHEEYFDLPAETARLLNWARRENRRIIAVGTTVVRALESSHASDGSVHPRSGWTDLVITPERGLKTVDGLLTGFHEPHSTHLGILAALAGYEHIEACYQAAILEGYLWHEFGDSHLILP